MLPLCQHNFRSRNIEIRELQSIKAKFWGKNAQDFSKDLIKMCLFLDKSS